jgi:hypothetical protein
VRVPDDDHHTDPVRAQQMVAEVEAVKPGGEHERPCEVNLPISHRNHTDIGRPPTGQIRSIARSGSLSTRAVSVIASSQRPEEGDEVGALLLGQLEGETVLVEVDDRVEVLGDPDRG